MPLRPRLALRDLAGFAIIAAILALGIGAAAAARAASPFTAWCA